MDNAGKALDILSVSGALSILSRALVRGTLALPIAN
jgi:hypothetical protein